MRRAVVYVHGLWFTGLEATALRRRVAAAIDARDLVFPYRSVRATISENAASLRSYLLGLRVDTLHVVAHSLGGVVVSKLFESPIALPPGRVVIVASPLIGCAAAHSVARLPFGRRVLGRGVAEELLQARTRRWVADRELGILAGSSPFGLGRVVVHFDEPNDGVVTVAETRLAGATEHLVLPVSHSGFLISRLASRHIAAFLQNGRFAG